MIIVNNVKRSKANRDRKKRERERENEITHLGHIIVMFILIFILVILIIFRLLFTNNSSVLRRLIEALIVTGVVAVSVLACDAERSKW